MLSHLGVWTRRTAPHPGRAESPAGAGLPSHLRARTRVCIQASLPGRPQPEAAPDARQLQQPEGPVEARRAPQTAAAKASGHDLSLATAPRALPAQLREGAPPLRGRPAGPNREPPRAPQRPSSHERLELQTTPGPAPLSRTRLLCAQPPRPRPAPAQGRGAPRPGAAAPPRPLAPDTQPSHKLAGSPQGASEQHPQRRAEPLQCGPSPRPPEATKASGSPAGDSGRARAPSRRRACEAPHVRPLSLLPQAP